jgi:hypothetical protein
MKLNFEELKKLENNSKNNPIYLDTVQSMIQLLLSNSVMSSTYRDNYLLAINSLSELGILELEVKPPVVQLNS